MRLCAALVLMAAAVVFYLRLHDTHASARGSTPSPSSRGSTATPALKTAPTSTPIASARATSAHRGDVIVQAKWGSGAGEMGRRREAESNPEMPMAIVAGARGDFAIVDQVNRRVQRFHDGKLAGIIGIGGDTVQDLALAAAGRTVLLDRLADRNVQVYGADGRLQNELSLVGPGVAEGGAVTGLFADDDGIYVESDHDRVVRIAGADGVADASRPQLAGRPTRDGRLLVRAAIADRGAAQVTVSAIDRSSGQPAWSQTLTVGAPILHIVMLDSDAHGMLYLAVDVGQESPAPPYAIADERIEVVRLGAGGAPRGVLAIPALATGDESFRPLSVDGDGVIYEMVPGESGLQVVTYRFQ